VFDEERLRELGHAERLRLIRALVAMESLDSGSDQAHRRRQAVGLATIIICCVIWPPGLACWRLRPGRRCQLSNVVRVAGNFQTSVMRRPAWAL